MSVVIEAKLGILLLRLIEDWARQFDKWPTCGTVAVAGRDTNFEQ